MSDNNSKNNSKDTTNKKSSKSRKSGSRVKGFFKVFFLVMLVLAITSCTLLGGYLYSIVRNTPPLDVNAILKLSETSTMVTADTGEFVSNIITNQQRFVIPSEDIPQNIKDAFISIEDERFYSHKGVDVKRLLGAQIVNIKNILAGKSSRQGGSTLTQQLIKNTVLTNEQSVERKVKEMYLAINLEKILSKDEILTAYLNTIPMGGQQYGIEAASLRFFGKSVKDLNLMQCAYLAGLTQAPSSYDAFSEKNQEDPSRYLNRTKTVLSKMKELGYITEEEYAEAILVDKEVLAFQTREEVQTMQHEWFTRPVVNQVKKDLQEKLKYTEDEANKLLLNGGLTIHVTMDMDLQNEVQKILDDSKNFTGAFARKYKKDTLTKEGVPQLQAAACIMDYRTGQVKALVGGRGNQPSASLNRAYGTLKSIGSTTKPLTVYAPAMDLKLMGSGTVIDDVPLTGSEQSSTGYKGIQPKNEYNGYRGYLTLREALRISSNVVAIKSVSKVGLANAKSYGEKFGLVYGEGSVGASALALGEFNDVNEGSNVYRMAAAYGSFGNNGILTQPILYTKVVDASGNILLENTPKQSNVISPQAAYIMYNVMKEPVENYSAKPAKFGSIPVSGKTGTTTGNKNYWFAGLTPYYSGAVWVGYDQPTTMPGSSGKNASPIWGKMMAKAHAGLGYKEISSPGGISKVAVCADSGHLPTELCKADPRGSRVRSEFFVSGTAPSKLCSTHVKATINKENGKLANDKTPPALVAQGVFITRPSGYKGTTDGKYLVPKEYDDTVYTPPVEEKPSDENKPNDNNNNSNNNNNNSNNKPNKPDNNEEGND